MSTVPIFRCASCSEYIAADAPTCRFCNSPVDFNRAMQSAVFEQQKNVLLNRASYLQIAATTLIPLGAIGLLFGLVLRAVWVGGILIPGFAIHTFYKLGTLGPPDADVSKGRRQCLVAIAFAGLIWLVVTALLIIAILASLPQ